jgi:ParB family chromosome partitioning protein
VRIYRGLYDEDSSRAESSFAFYLEDPSLVTLGMIYEKNGRFAGGAYHPVLRRVQTFTDESLKHAIKNHEKISALTESVETNVASVIEKLKARGLVSPYLRSFVVARINPLRWIKSETLPSAEEVLMTMRDRAAKFNVDKVNPNDLAKASGPPDDAV